jgi:hypothetical protein
MRWGVVLVCVLGAWLACRLDKPSPLQRDSAALAPPDSEATAPCDARSSAGRDGGLYYYFPDTSFPDVPPSWVSNCAGVACGVSCIRGACDGDGGCAPIFDHAYDIAEDAGVLDAGESASCPAEQPEVATPCTVEGQICLYPPLFCEPGNVNLNIAVCFCGGFRLEEHNCFVFGG